MPERAAKPPGLGTNLYQHAQRNCRASLTNASARAQGRLRSFPAKRVLGPAFTPGASPDISALLSTERPVPRAFSLKWLEPSRAALLLS